MHRRLQFGTRENTAPSRQHASRTALGQSSTDSQALDLLLDEVSPCEFGPNSIGIAKAIEPVWNCVDAARFLRLHPKTVKRMARLGQIPGCRLGRRWFFRPSDLDTLLRGGVSSPEKANRVAPQLSS